MSLEKSSSHTITFSFVTFQEVLGYKIENMTSMYIVAILEYISSDILVVSHCIMHNTVHAYRIKQ